MLTKNFKKFIGTCIIGCVFLCTLQPSVFASDISDKSVAEELGASEFQIDSLRDMGYSFDEILNMTLEQIDQYLIRDLNEDERKRYFDAKNSFFRNITPYATAPSGYVKILSVPNGGGSNEYFHPNAGVNSNTIDYVVARSEAIAQRIFNTTTTYNLDNGFESSYYLFGEWGEDPGRENWCHEGIDMKWDSRPTANVYSPKNGYVTKVQSMGTGNGTSLTIYCAPDGITGGFNLNIQHLDLKGVSFNVGDYVQIGQKIGQVGTGIGQGHIHVQVCTHANCTIVHSGKNLNLECVAPWNYLALPLGKSDKVNV